MKAKEGGIAVTGGMSRFHLHLHNAHVEASDEEGLDLPDLETARARAIAGIRDFIGHEAMKGELDFRGQVDITDETDAILATIRFVEAFTIRGLERADTTETNN